MNNRKVNIYIDESGDTGIKFSEGSSRFFIVSLLIINNEDVSKTEGIINKIKDTLNMKQKELKFSQTPFNKKFSFFKKIKKVDFIAHVFIYNKIVQQNFSWYISQSLKYLKFDDIKNIKITIDGLDKNKLTGDNIKTIGNIYKGIRVKIIFEDSKKNILLQFSDMLAGLVNSTNKNKMDYKVLLKMIENKIKITQIE